MNFSFEETSCYFISLDHRNDRREDLSNNFRSMGFNLHDFEWIHAIKDVNFGGLGCAKSHLTALTEFITKSRTGYCCIIEDDFRFRVSKQEAQNIISYALSNLRPDVILLAGTQTITIPTRYKAVGHEIEKIFQANSASGYIVKREYVNKIIAALLDAIIGMESNIHIEPRGLIYQNFAFDQIWKYYQQKDDWICTNPMIGHQAPGFSDIEQKEVDYSLNSH